MFDGLAQFDSKLPRSVVPQGLFLLKRAGYNLHKPFSNPRNRLELFIVGLIGFHPAQQVIKGGAELIYIRTGIKRWSRLAFPDILLGSGISGGSQEAGATYSGLSMRISDSQIHKPDIGAIFYHDITRLYVKMYDPFGVNIVKRIQNRKHTFDYPLYFIGSTGKSLSNISVNCHTLYQTAYDEHGAIDIAILTTPYHLYKIAVTECQRGLQTGAFANSMDTRIRRINLLDGNQIVAIAIVAAKIHAPHRSLAKRWLRRVVVIPLSANAQEYLAPLNPDISHLHPHAIILLQRPSHLPTPAEPEVFELE